MRLLFCFTLMFLPLSCWAENPKCYLINDSENRTKFLLHFTDQEKYYILDKTTKKYTPTDSLTCLSERDFPAPRYVCVITD
jgi:hypothetical protein